ncbi:uncharacterized protein I303_108087 [Kwoniella dejecticola CBS 10117]|uniref:Uncharacterized protein n=1 Tax=Kwoniella dejecticola CBS 10117 TaxID=1296121 RepID=A0A1A5ZWI4_9TREE|nr:uncharacterized protein I303_08078 [Kwoniella dejecticola CBS 10117]OBR82164.1 hypothetical protein I303_08078 [Kwoniella dejecticola CBS 10117]
MLSEITNLPPLPPSPSSSSHRRSSSVRLSFHPEHQAQSSPNRSRTASRPTVKKLPSSIRLFQEQHLNEFAHLHLSEHEQRTSEEREQMLAAEKEKLEEARQIGRAKRQTMAHHLVSSLDDKENMNSRNGWRPLSLLARRQPLTKPTTLLVNPPSQPSFQHQKRRRYSNRTELVTPTEIDTPDLSSHLPSEIDINSPDLALVTPNQLELALGCSSPPPIPIKSEARREVKPGINDGNNSIQSSTYSWASSFSGETAELRTAAHYVPPISEERATPDNEEGPEEVLDSPEKVKRRRKRIVAIAHTVRQLEGIGSRDVEDPNFYHQLVKAWNDRPGNVQPVEAVWSPATTVNPSPPPIPPRPNQRGLADPYLAPPTWLAPPSFNPLGSHDTVINGSPVPSSNLEHHSPNPDDEQSTNDHSDESCASSNPFRYSYASSIHDLAFAEALQHGNKLMNEKAWLKSPLFDQGTWFDANTPSAPLPAGQFSMAPRVPSPTLAESPSKSSENDAESACVPTNTPLQRTLRRQNDTVSRLKDRHQDPGFIDAPLTLAGPSQAGPSSAPPITTTNWGLGFLGNWLKDELKDETQPQQGFQYGEEGMTDYREQPDPIVNTRQNNSKTSSFLAEGDIVGFPASLSGAHIYQRPSQSAQVPIQEDLDIETEMTRTDGMISMETIPLSTNTNSNNSINSNIVLPPPLPTPEIEIIAQRTGQPKEMISPKQPDGCLVLAKEYQLSNPYPRQNYSIPSDILHPPASASHQEPLLIPSLNDPSPQRQRQSCGDGDLEVEVEQEANLSEHQALSPPLPPRSKSRAEEEESWDLSEISSYQYQYLHRTPPLNIIHHDKIPTVSTLTTTTTMKTPQLHGSFPKPSSTPSNLDLDMDKTETLPPRTPKSALRPDLPPLPPTPKYRRATPPLLVNSSSLMRDQEILKSINGSDKAGAGCPHPGPHLSLDQIGVQAHRPSQHLNYDHSSYPRYTERDIASMRMNTVETLREEHPSYPAATTADSSEDSQHSIATSNVTGIDGTPRIHPSARNQVDTEKGLPQNGHANLESSPSPNMARAPMALFILGFVCPLLWFVGGWSIRSSPSPALGHPASAAPKDVIATTPSKRTRIINRIFDHPDSMVRKCRYAAVISTPIILVAVAIIVVLVLLL